MEESGFSAFLGLAAEVGDEDVDRVRLIERVISPDLFEQALARDDEAAIPHQVLEQLEFPLGEFDLAVATHGFLRVRVEPQVTDREQGRTARRMAPEQGADARQQFGPLEGLDQVVVGAGVEAGDPVLGVGPGGQHQDRHLRVLAQLGAHLEAVHSGQSQVEHDQVGHELGGDLQPLRAVTARPDFIALGTQCPPEHVNDVVVVLDDQDAASQ